MWSRAKNIAAVPQAPLARVGRSGRWKSRVIEKWRGMVSRLNSASFRAPRSQEAARRGCPRNRGRRYQRSGCRRRDTASRAGACSPPATRAPHDRYLEMPARITQDPGGPAARESPTPAGNWPAPRPGRLGALYVTHTVQQDRSALPQPEMPCSTLIRIGQSEGQDAEVSHRRAKRGNTKNAYGSPPQATANLRRYFTAPKPIGTYSALYYKVLDIVDQYGLSFQFGWIAGARTRPSPGIPAGAAELGIGSRPSRARSREETRMCCDFATKKTENAEPPAGPQRPIVVAET